MEPRRFWTKNFNRFFDRSRYDNETRIDDVEVFIHPSQKISGEPSTSEMVTHGQFLFTENLQCLFESAEVSASLKDSSKVMLFKLEIKDIYIRFLSVDLDELAKKCLENSIVIFLATKDRKRFFLYWKSKQIQQFLTLKIYNECDYMYDLRLFEFIVKFLANSLRRGHLGLHSKLKIDKTTSMFYLHLLADHRNYNLLLIAAELGDIYIVHFLLDAGFSTESHDTNAQTLAYNGRHFDIVSSLLKSNLTYPSNISIQECPDDIKEFYEVSRSLNEAMMSRNSAKVLEILSQNQEMKHFYNLDNESALAFALKHKLLDMYRLLISEDATFGPHEKFSEIKEKLKESERVELREIHFEESKFMPDNHMHVLLSNIRFAPGTTEPKQKYKIVQKAFEILNENPFIKIILMVVAASRNFRVVFDFDRDSVEHIDPTADASMKGLFYTSGRIYIAAKQLLNPTTKFEALGTLAHELCHYAMNLVYKNMARPYKIDDLEAEQQFEEISKFCKENHEKEEIIEPVYKCYPQRMQHAELIVRVPHLIMEYFNNQRRLEEVRGIFGKLFEIFEKKIVTEMEEALPVIEAEEEFESQKDKKKIRNLSLLSVVLGLLAVIGIISGIFVTRLIFYKPTYKFNDLSVDDRNTAFSATVTYKNTSIKFRDLFPENSPVYEKLAPNHISQMLEGITLDLDDPHLRYLEEQVIHNWQNLTRKLREKILTSNFTFQDENLKFQKLYEVNSEVFNSLNSSQIIDVLSGKKLVVHKMVKSEAKFYFERNFWDEYMRPIYYSFMKSVGYLSIMHNSSDTTKFFDNYYRKFAEKDVSTQLNEINVITEKEEYKELKSSEFRIQYYDMSQEKTIILDTLSSHKSLQFGLDHALKSANTAKIFILSAEAGTGKTSTFEHFAMRIKKEFPTQWVSYIDLKDHKALYKEIKTLQDVKKMLENIFGLSSVKEFEKKIFEQFIEAGNLILLWNGFDEISPDYSEDVMRILGLIRNGTGIIQFLCTRPLYSDQLKLKFLVQTYTLVPFDAEEQESFVRSFLTSQNTEEAKMTNYVEKVQRISNSSKSDNSEEGFDTPLLILMVAKLISEDFEIYETENLYEIYRKFVDMKIEIWKQKSEFGRNFLGNLSSKHHRFDMLKLYQSYAMKSEFQIKRLSQAYFYSLKLKIMRQKVPEELTLNEISQMGILFINNLKNFRFAHRTFGEFFVAQYLIENVYDAIDEPANEEAELRIQVLYYSFDYPGVTRFIDSFLQTKSANETIEFDPKLSTQLNTKFQKFFLTNVELYDTSAFPLLLNFFKKDPKIFKNLLRIDEDETVYTAVFRFAFEHYVSAYDPYQIKNLVRPHLTDDEFEKFIHGKNQKGIILFSLHGISCNVFNRYNISHEVYKLDKKLVEIKDPFKVFELIAKNLTKAEIKSFLKSAVSVYNAYYEALSIKRAFTEKMWNFIEKEFTVPEQKEILVNYFSNAYPKAYSNDIDNDFDYFLKKLESLFINVELFEIFSTYNVMYTFINYNDFFVNHTTPDQMRDFLQTEMSESTEFDTSFNLLLYSLFGEVYVEFTKMQEIYESYFNKTEIKKILLSSSTDFFPIYVTHYGNYEELFLNYIKRIFAGDKESLREFLLRKIEPTNLNVFELMKDYYDPYNDLENLSNLLK